MPVKKSKRELFGKIVGRFINQGLSLEDAKVKADRAIKSRAKKKAKK